MPDDRDATLADFSHEVGHSCSPCWVIRRLAPQPPRCNLGRHISERDATARADIREAKRRAAEIRWKQDRARRSLLKSIRAA